VIAERLLVTVTSGTMTSLLDASSDEGWCAASPILKTAARSESRSAIWRGPSSISCFLRCTPAEREIMAVLRADECKVFIRLLDRLQDRMREVSAQPVILVAAMRRRPPPSQRSAPDGVG
jgi:hypothetical protein